METWNQKVGNIEVFYSQYQNGGGPFYNKFNRQILLEYKEVDALEICSGPGFIGYDLLESGIASHVDLSDKNPAVEEYINKTNSISGHRTRFYQSDALDSVPLYEYSVIIGNPPHLQTEEQYKLLEDDGFVDPSWPKERLEYERRILLDKDFSFHKKFFSKVDEYIKIGGSIVLYENADFIKPEELINLASNSYDHSIFRSIFRNEDTKADFYALKSTRFK